MPGIERLALEDVARPDEAGDELRARPRVDFLRRAQLLDPPAVHHRDEIGGGHRLRLVMGHVDRGVAVGVVQAADLEAHLLAQIGVEIRQRLVEEQRLRLDDEGAGERDALLLAAGEFARIARGEVGELGRREDAGDLLGDLRPRQLAQRQAIGDVLGDRHVRPQRVALKDHRHLARFRRQRARRRRHHPVTDRDLAGRRLDEARDQAQRRRLAAAGRTEQADEETVVDAERDVVDHGRRVIALGQVPQLDRRHPFVSISSCCHCPA